MTWQGGVVTMNAVVQPGCSPMTGSILSAEVPLSKTASVQHMGAVTLLNYSQTSKVKGELL